MADKIRAAAQYLRMSTDTQDLSPEIQAEAIRNYALQNEIAVVRTYLDAGKSGLTLAKRPAMKRLLADVTDPHCPFSMVLVYDVSRWGRFQDTDASAYYEYHCRLHGTDVRYVQEPFGGIDSPLGALLKGLKRAMAAEYSRELSIKTTAGQSAAVSKGFQLGTLPCLGVARVAVSKADGSERPLGPRDHKSGRGEHVRWVPGPHEEIEAVRRIFHLYTTTELNVVQVARLACAEGVRARTGRPVTEWMLYRLLRCESLTGDFVWGREENKKRRSPGDPKIKRSPGFMHPIISRQLFDVAQAKLDRRRHVVFTKEQLIEQLRAALQHNPRLRGEQLQAYGCACRTTYLKYFGTMRAAWDAAGHSLRSQDAEDGEAIAASLKRGAAVCRNIALALRAAGLDCAYHCRADRNSQTLLINQRTILRTQVVCRRPRFDGFQWYLRKVYKGSFDWALVVRANEDGSPFDSFLVDRRQYFAMDVWLNDALPGTWKQYCRMDQVVNLLREMEAATH
jgi:DNA invertase Pin-like site-specific DNA recombinase